MALGGWQSHRWKNPDQDISLEWLVKLVQDQPYPESPVTEPGPESGRTAQLCFVELLFSLVFFALSAFDEATSYENKMTKITHLVKQI